MKRNTLYIVLIVVLVILGAGYFFVFSDRSLDTSKGTEVFKRDSLTSLYNTKPSDQLVAFNDSPATNSDSVRSQINKEKPGSFKNKVMLGDTVNLKDFGVTGTGKDETVGFQNAINAAVGKVLYVPRQLGPYYLTRQLIIPSNSTLIFDADVILQATDDLKQNIADFESLLRIENVSNVVLQGNNALFRMRKEAYSGEHNHIFMINGASNVKIEGTRAHDSGGDGFYVGAYKTPALFSENISIINCRAFNNTRQGLSVISVTNLLVDGCKFDQSNGADPETGLDIEPARSTDVLKNVRIMNSSASGNKKRGFLVLLNRLSSKSEPVDIIFENCVAEGNMEGFSNRQFSGVQGIVEYINCTARNSRVTGFTESSCLASSAKKVYRRCISENSNIANRKMDNHLFKAGYYLSGNAKNRQIIGNSEFIDCKSITNGKSKNVEYGMVVDNGDADVKNIIVKNFESQGHQKEAFLAPSRPSLRGMDITID